MKAVRGGVAPILGDFLQSLYCRVLEVGLIPCTLVILAERSFKAIKDFCIERSASLLRGIVQARMQVGRNAERCADVVGLSALLHSQ